MKLKKSSITFAIALLVFVSSLLIVYESAKDSPIADNAYVKIKTPLGCVKTTEFIWDWEARQYLYYQAGIPMEERCFVWEDKING